jgi:hypothetical protein
MPIDHELAPVLAADALASLDHLLTGQRPGVPVTNVAALVRLIRSACPCQRPCAPSPDND